MGRVYCAEDPDSGQTVAIKVLTQAVGQDDSFVRRFRREAEVLRRLKHPNIVQLLDAGEHDGHPYLVLEYIEGTQLSELIRRVGRVPWRQAVEWCVEICDALAHAHQAGVVHRDIKPANVLITLDGHVKLTDFGIAQRLDGTRLTTTGSILGTVEYMSPEQAEGKRVDARSDLYSLGALLYHMLTGRPPFTGSSYVEVLKRLRFDQPERVQQIAKDVPIWLDDLVDALLQKQRERRPATATEVKQRLLAVLEKVRYRDTEQFQLAIGAEDDDGDATVSEAPTQALASPPSRPGPTTLARRFKLEETVEGRPLERSRRMVARILGGILLLALVWGAYSYWSHSRDPARRWAALEAELNDPNRNNVVLIARLREFVESFPDSPYADKAREALAELELTAHRRQLFRSALVRSLRPTGSPVSPLERRYIQALLTIWLESPTEGLSRLEELLDLLSTQEKQQTSLAKTVRHDYVALALEVAEAAVSNGDFDTALNVAERVRGRMPEQPEPAIRPLLRRLNRIGNEARSRRNQGTTSTNHKEERKN